MLLSFLNMMNSFWYRFSKLEKTWVEILKKKKTVYGNISDFQLTQKKSNNPNLLRRLEYQNKVKLCCEFTRF